MRLLRRLRAARRAPAPTPDPPPIPVRAQARGWPAPPPPPNHPPLTAAEVTEAEEELGIRFPPAYRSYLTEVSSGGRLHRLAKGPAGWWWDENDTVQRDLLRLPFPHPDSYAADGGPWGGADEYEDRETAGAVVLQDNGCGFATLLALTGPLAGTVWWDGRATCELIVPLSFDHPGGAPPLTFQEWRDLGLTDLSHLLGPDWGGPADF